MKKFLTLTISLLFIICAFCTIVSAEETSTQILKQPEIVMSDDSVAADVTYTVTYDVSTNSNILVLSVDTLGVRIYDDPETSYIDGIRLNGETVNSLNIPIDLSQTNKITVRTVYREDITGTLAQMADGTYDYMKLLENPLALLMGIYYVFSITSVVIGICAALFGKKKKVKTAEETASAVDKHAEIAFDKLTVNFISEVTNTLEPMFKTMSDTQNAIVKAVILMNSKEGDSHLQALKCLEAVASVDVKKVIETVHTELDKAIQTAKTHKQETIDTLTQIAETTQEVSADVSTPPVF